MTNQTITFWYLQIYLIELTSYFSLEEIAEAIDQRHLKFKNLSHEDFATELALYMSGIK